MAFKFNIDTTTRAPADYGMREFAPVIIQPGMVREDQHAVLSTAIHNLVQQFHRDQARLAQGCGKGKQRTREAEILDGTVVPCRATGTIEGEEVSLWVSLPATKAPEAAVAEFREYISSRARARNNVAKERADHGGKLPSEGGTAPAADPLADAAAELAEPDNDV